jgi:hypothetical protein
MHSPQSSEQVEQDSLMSQKVSPQKAGHSPQSSEQVEQDSSMSQKRLPQYVSSTGSPLVTVKFFSEKAPE